MARREASSKSLPVKSNCWRAGPSQIHSPSEGIPGAFFFFRKKGKALDAMPKRIMEEHQEPGKERQYTQVVSLPNPPL